MGISKAAAGGLAVALGATLVITACGSKSNSSATPSGSSSPSGTIAGIGAGTPSKGGTLKILGEDDNSNYDPNGVYDTNSASLIRLYARQLYSNHSSNNPADRLPIIPDLAVGMPDVSSDGLTYTIKLNTGAKWNSGAVVTAADVVRGFKAICNPVAIQTSPASYLSLIAGMKDYCDGFGKVSATSASAIAAYNEKPVSGLTAVDDSTVKITLVSKATDFIHILTLDAFSARPMSAGQYVPESPQARAHMWSDGPYTLTSYTADKSATFTRNTSWDASTDKLRDAYPDVISVTMGLEQSNIQQQLQAGSADMALGNEPLPAASISTLKRAADKKLTFNPTGGINPYIIFNLDAPSSPSAKQAVRQALQYAVNKTAVAQVLGGSSVATPFNQIFPQGVVGAGWQQQDLYPTPNDSGDPAKAKTMLAAAGYPNGLTLKFAYRTTGNGPKIYATLVDAFKAAGVTIKGIPLTGKEYYGTYLPSDSNRTSGAWDIAEPGWGPDWEGASERSFYSPLLTLKTGGSNNFGHYSSDAVDTAATAALAESDPTKAAADWNAIDKQIMTDAPWIPLIQNVQANYFGPRVRNFEWSFVSNQGDYANVAVQ